MAEKRITLAEALDTAQASKHNSDMANLASALENVSAEMERLSTLREEIHKAAREIEAGEVYDMREVRKLYDLSKGVFIR